MLLLFQETHTHKYVQLRMFGLTRPVLYSCNGTSEMEREAGAVTNAADTVQLPDITFCRSMLSRLCSRREAHSACVLSSNRDLYKGHQANHVRQFRENFNPNFQIAI